MADNNSVLTVSIVTPDGKVYEREDARLVIVRTKSGQLGIMPNHVPVIASLEVDEVKVKSGSDVDEIAVNGGFVEFSNNNLTVIADSAEKQGDIDVDRAAAARDRAQKALEIARQKHDNQEILRNQVALRRAINRMHVAKH
ncbi:F0F1 ATP synthase subunit epsilon [Apilactobacillus kunkeei]|uniref:ATP synthase epsilon chain n=3 Tax=Apilactobacillus TaxID=2767877 RepID=A0A0C2VWF6_9LACO|nr:MULTISPECIES: F0F1 ATP synthase subunit epsilon [Apilactobacillus]MBI0091819.1 F0F1 ATP synthase subunit epsilon [Lactobacillus sp. M0345]MCL8495860.1 F0F1 ATP synthase subunit epsilon [Apilactobacillus sp. F1]KDB00506.1 ATP synthase F1 subcomplex epsilon subunit [Apilactobacillus kunkeei EFB6]KDB00665.1 ATP synthase F1 subcomplex epsilon subunit [Apilactobacillus kunkeei EFB6]KIM18653.1 ATP synthase subunit epsilon [Apilactobacillus kunkeei]